MALINMDKIGANLMHAMGVSPDQVRGFVVTVLQEVSDIKADRLAFRPASQRAYLDVTTRLDRMEGNIATLMRHFGLSTTEQGTDSDAIRQPEPDSIAPVANGRDHTGPAPAPGGN